MRQTIISITIVFFILEFYVYQAFKTLVQNQGLRIAYIVINALIYAYVFYGLIFFQRSSVDQSNFQRITTVFLAFLFPKLLVALFLFIDDIFRLFQFGFEKIKGTSEHYPSRRKFLSLAGLGFGGLLATAFLDGALFGKYRHRVKKVKLKLEGLPKAFKGYKIVQISDVHSGSFDDPKKLQSAIDLINEQNADLVLFTGDMVNNVAEEFKPFVSLFGSIESKDGKFSVLGNHDYGFYFSGWKSQQEKDRNVPYLIELQRQAGFEMLRNEHRKIEKNGESIYILGVENWGLKPFPQFGDLNKALENVPTDSTKILMSHDPTHFDEIVKHHSSKVHLTLSGHTHGMQFGLDLKNVKWSPVQYRYKKWADLYESMGRYLYVNRGFGVLGYPGRVGILPEITVFELS